MRRGIVVFVSLCARKFLKRRVSQLIYVRQSVYSMNPLSYVELSPPLSSKINTKNRTGGLKIIYLVCNFCSCDRKKKLWFWKIGPSLTAFFLFFTFCYITATTLNAAFSGFRLTDQHKVLHKYNMRKTNTNHLKSRWCISICTGMPQNKIPCSQLCREVTKLKKESSVRDQVVDNFKAELG